MLIRWSDIDGAFSRLDEVRRQMNRWANENSRFLANGETFGMEQWSRGWPRMLFVDSGKELVLRAEIPGMDQNDIDISVNQDVLTLSGERRTEVPEGYQIHRHERASLKFSRSFALACKVDLERSSAVVKNGVLTVTLPKAPESQPRQITVKAQ